MSIPNMSLGQLAQVASLVGALLIGGIRLGSLESKVVILENRKDQTEDVATVKQQVQDLTNDVRDMRTDVRDIKRLLSGTAHR